MKTPTTKAPVGQRMRYVAPLLLALLLGGCGLLRINIVYPDAPPPTSTPPQQAVMVPDSPTPTQQVAEIPIKERTGGTDAKATATATPGANEADPTDPPSQSTETAVPPARPTDTPVTPQIIAFDVSVQDKDNGSKVVTCSWETTGAARARVTVGTARRFMPWRDVDPTGTVTFDLATTLYEDPDVTLIAFGKSTSESQVQASVTLDWPCEHDYFFESGDDVAPAVAVPQICPASEPLSTSGAQQPFENGSMIWLEDVEEQDVVYVLYDNYVWESYEDTWEEGEPDQDPRLSPPEGRRQPIRGFGKVWRDHPDVRERLGWATAGEQAYTAVHQRQISESIGGVQYIRTIDDRVVELSGLGGYGSMWAYLP